MTNQAAPRLALVALLLNLACSEDAAVARDSETSASATQSQDEDAVRAAVYAHWTAIEHGDTAAIASHHTPDMTSFGPESEHLVTLSADEPATAELWQRFRGATAAWTPRDVRVKVYGDVAIAAFFNEGSATYSDGTIDSRRRRVTEVWVRQPDGTWKEAHHHDSPIGS